MPFIDIDVVDSSQNDPALLIARQTYPNHIPANSVWTMVDGIITRLSLTRSDTNEPVGIGRLRIIGHGMPGQQAIGRLRATSARPHRRQLIALDNHGHLLNRGTLIQLRGRFSSGMSVVELHGCRVGRDGGRLRHALEALWGIRVEDRRVLQDPATPDFDYSDDTGANDWD